MSGHSKWSTIKRAKGITDAKRGGLFTKLSNAISIAVREGGGGDVNFNFKLRLAVDKAKEANMPKDNIARAIDKGLGKGEENSLATAVYEGFGPGGVAVIVETITDNTTRTGAALRNYFSKAGVSLGSPGAVSYMFTRFGEIQIMKSETVSYDTVFEKALEAGAEDVEESNGEFFVYTKVEDLHKVKEKMESLGVKVQDSEIIYKPNKETVVTLDNSKRELLGNFLEALSDLDDVHSVFVNIAN